MTFKSKVIAGLATASAVLLLVALLSYFSLVRNVEDRRWVTHTYQVLAHLDAVQSNMIDAETGERGYIITGEDSFLQPYENGLDHVYLNLKDLRSFTADNPVQQRALVRLEPLVNERLEVLRDRIQIRRQRGLTAGVRAVREGPGKQLMDQIRIVIAEMKQEEDRLLVQRSAELEASAHSTRVVLVSGEGLGFVFLIAAGLVIYREMGQRKRAEDEIRKLNEDLERRVAQRTLELAERAKDLERSNMELQQFAYVASHDLQEPLRTIASFTQLLAKRYHDKLDDKAREFINFAVDGSKRMQTLINDLLAFSRVGTQGKPLAAVRTDAVLDRVLKTMKLAIEESGAVISRDPLPIVVADEMQLGQLFQNLLGNAVKFRGERPPRIHVSAESHGETWTISVRDNGIGISPEHKDRIFVIFQRLHTKTQYAGTGIGLAICKKIAERHGGHIWVEPSPGGGSTFYFTIANGETRNSKEQQHDLQRVDATAD
jgi:signal transduction histidine kinase